MTTRILDPRFLLVHAGVDRQAQAFAEDVRAGLTASPKRLHCRYFYDRAGSLLFEEICELPEYYLTRAEREIFLSHADAIAARVPAGVTLVELGSGSAVKTRLVIEALRRRRHGFRYVPIDISGTILEESSRALLAEYPDLQIVAIAGEYEDGVARLGTATTPPRLVLWLGSNIGNFSRGEAAEFLARIRARLAPEDRLLCGIDLRKDPAVLERAYDDARGVTARFNLNLLVRINRELGGHFDPAAFRHRAVYDEEEGRVAMYLVSARRQRVTIDRLGLAVSFDEGEAMHTEDSFKYSPDEIGRVAQHAGFDIETRWVDSGGRFSLNLLSSSQQSSAERSIVARTLAP
jgi:L-histidine Nalpha-methyltransferase